MHNQKVVLGLYGLIAFMSILQLSAGGVSISSGKALSSNLSSTTYEIFYSLQAGYYIVVALFSLALLTLLVLCQLVFKSVSFLKLSGQYLILLLLACFQFSMAICSSINAKVVADQSYKFDIFPYTQCNLPNMKGIITAVAVMTWLLVLPSLGWLIASMWGEWRKGMDKDGESQRETIEMNQEQEQGSTGRQSVRKPLY